MDPRAIALQGLGYSATLVAFQGLRPAGPPAPLPDFMPMARQRPERKRRDRDDDVLLFLLR